MFNVLFVCTENTCRSPMAEYLLKHLAKQLGVKGLKVKSAGIYTNNLSKLSKNSKLALKDLNINVRYTPKPLTKDLAESADLILAVTMEHKILISLKYSVLNKLWTIGEYVGGADIADPYGKDLEEYKKCCGQIYDYCCIIIRKLIKEGKVHV